jgi:hypothetical protein
MISSIDHVTLRPIMRLRMRQLQGNVAFTAYFGIPGFAHALKEIGMPPCQHGQQRTEPCDSRAMRPQRACTKHT